MKLELPEGWMKVLLCCLKIRSVFSRFWAPWPVIVEMRAPTFWCWFLARPSGVKDRSVAILVLLMLTITFWDPSIESRLIFKLRGWFTGIY